MNISGTRYCVPVDVINQRGVGLLHVFVTTEHETRIHMCSAFFEHTQEYFFARYTYHNVA
jgi:hypothetical protein